MEMASPRLGICDVRGVTNFFLQSIPLRIAREAVAKCQTAVSGKEQDKKTIKQLRREIKDQRKRIPSDQEEDAALVAQTNLVNKSRTLEE